MKHYRGGIGSHDDVVGRARVNRRRCSRALLLATTALTTALWATTPAVSSDWTGAVSNSWWDGANWSAGTPPDWNTTANIDTTSPNPALLSDGSTLVGELNVGVSGTGVLTVSDSDIIVYSHLYIGRNADSSGTVNASGQRGFWTDGNLYVGFDGTGAFSLSNGVVFSGYYAFLGMNSGSSGSLKLDGANTIFNLQNDLHVGTTGTGTLSISNGARFQGSQFHLGTNLGAVGTATVDGAGSSMWASTFATVGGAGHGTLNIRNGGVVTVNNSSNFFIANDATGWGVVNVDGAGSQLNANTSVGYAGTGFLNVTNGGRVDAGGSNIEIGFQNGSNGTATVTGFGSTLNAYGVYVGYEGSGVLTVANGGIVNATDFFVGGDAFGGRGGVGTVNIGAASGSAPVAPGVINASALQFSGAGNLVFNHTSQNYTFAPVISGNAEVTVEAGTTILSGANTYTGDTTINGGTLLVNGSTNSSGLVMVNPGGTLGGTGNVGAVFLDNRATLAPGTPGSIGTLTINNALMMCDCSSYFAKADNLGNADKAVVNGAAFVDGALKVAPTTWIGSATNYTILSATGGVSGDFASSAVTRPGWARVVGWNTVGDDVILTLDRGSLAAAMPSNATGNQKAVGNAIDTAIAGGAAPNAQLIALMGLTGSALTTGLDRVSGQGASQTTQTGTIASNQFMTAMFDPFAMGRTSTGSSSGMSSYASADDAMAYAGKKRGRVVKAANDIVAPAIRDDRFEQRWGVWASGYGGSTTTSGNAAAGQSDVRSSGFGVVAGADYRVTPQTMIGFALGGGGSSFAVSQGLGSGSADMFQAGLFARHDMGAAYLSGGFSYTYQDVTTTRTVIVSGSDQLQAKFNANTFAGRVEGGYRFDTAVAAIAPYAALQVTQINLPGYSESAKNGSSGFALSYGKNDTTITRTELGARIERAFALEAALLTLRGRAAWAHDEGNDGAVSATFASLPGSSFTVNGLVPAKDLALISAGAELQLANNVIIGGSFEGEFSGITRGYGGKGSVRYVW